MQARAFGNALIVALASIFLALGAFSISLAEFAPGLTPTAPPSLPSPMPVTLAPTTLPPPTNAALIVETETPTTTPTTTITATPPGACPEPQGWAQTIVQPYDTLESIAARYRVDASQLRSFNCLLSDTLVSGSILYVPPVPANTAPPVNTAPVCKQGPAGWVFSYRVQPGDNFYSIASKYGVTAATLQNGNCRTTNLLYPGEILWVPNVPTRVPPSLTLPPPLPSNTPLPQPTDPLTATALPYTATSIPSPTFPPNTPTPMPTVAASLTAFP